MQTSIAHFTIATRDVAQTAAFFTHTLGWPPIERPGNLDQAAAWLQIAPDQELHLIQVADFEPSLYEREFGRHFAIRFPESEFDELKKRLVEQGAELIPPQRPTPFERFFSANRMAISLKLSPRDTHRKVKPRKYYPIPLTAHLFHIPAVRCHAQSAFRTSSLFCKASRIADRSVTI